MSHESRIVEFPVSWYGEQAKIVSQGRTSSNAWCGSACESNPKVRNVYFVFDMLLTEEYAASRQLILAFEQLYQHIQLQTLPICDFLICGFLIRDSSFAIPFAILHFAVDIFLC